MTNITAYPLEEGFETTLAQERDGATGTVYVNSAPSFTFPSGVTTYIVVNPGKSTMQVAEINAYDSSAKTLTVSDITLEKGASVSYSQQTHSVGSVVRISNNYEFRKVLYTAINSKVDGNTQGFPVYADATARDAAITSPTNGMVIYNTAEGLLQGYVGGSWTNLESGGTFVNASETAAGKVEEGTDAENTAGASVGGTGAKLFVTPAKNAKVIQSGSYVYAGASSGGTDTYAVTMTPTLTAYTTGMSLIFKADVANTGACTLNVDGLGATSLKMIDGDDPVDGEIAANQLVYVIYDGTNFVVQNPPALATGAEVKTGTDTKKYVTPKTGSDNFGWDMVGGDTYTLATANTEQSTTGTSYTKVKEVEIGQDASSLKFTFDLRSSATGGFTAYGRIYKNGSAVGTEKTESGNSYVTQTDTVSTWVAGDLAQLYYKIGGAQTAYVRNFSITYDMKPKPVSGHSATVNLN